MSDANEPLPSEHRDRARPTPMIGCLIGWMVHVHMLGSYHAHVDLVDVRECASAPGIRSGIAGDAVLAFIHGCHTPELVHRCWWQQVCRRERSLLQKSRG